MEEILIIIEHIDPLEFFGINNSKIKIIQTAFPDSRIITRGNEIRLFGKTEEVRLIESRINCLLDYLEKNGDLPEDFILKTVTDKKQVKTDSNDVEHKTTV